MEKKSKTVLLISDRGDKKKRALFKKAVAAAYAETGLEPIWKGRVSKKVIHIK